MRRLPRSVRPISRLSAPLTLTLGLRYTRASYTGQAYYAGPVIGAPVSSSGSLTEYPVTPKAGLSYRRDSDSLWYVTVSKGYRIGGTNPDVGQFCYGGAVECIGLDWSCASASQIQLRRRVELRDRHGRIALTWTSITRHECVSHQVEQHPAEW